ncbi:TetR family transcriptional regulator C-terminal domain-containing protein [Mycobacterium sp. NPDC006124]|uniref:TetR family transcriptional regulator C-terminal domain-containing protein n=1 Tax=Mycobacterium sp. NPDC006124 TaxID=3156729 RepID=UPI0033B9312F
MATALQLSGLKGYHLTNQRIGRDRTGLNYSENYWGEWTNYVDPDHSTWESLTKNKVMALPIDFTTIEPGIDLVRFRTVLQYYSDIISGFSNKEHLGPLIKRLESRVPDIKKLIVAADDDYFGEPLVVVSLRDVNLAMRKVIPLLLCKHLYDLRKQTDPENAKFLNLIIDEAHNILSTESSRETEAWRDYRLETFEELIKEGRVWGLSEYREPASARHDLVDSYLPSNDLSVRAWKVWLALWAEGSRDPVLQEINDRLYGQWRDVVAGVIAAAQAEGTVGDGDPVLLANMLIGMLDGLAVQVLLGSSSMTLGQMRETCQAFVSGVIEG